MIGFEWPSKQGKGLYRLALQNVAVGRSFLIGLDRNNESSRNNGMAVRWGFLVYNVSFFAVSVNL